MKVNLWFWSRFFENYMDASKFCYFTIILPIEDTSENYTLSRIDNSFRLKRYFCCNFVNYFEKKFTIKMLSDYLRGRPEKKQMRYAD